MATNNAVKNLKSRQKARYAAQLKVEVFSKGFEHQHIERTANISETGLFICTNLESEIGDKMHLRIILADREAFFDVKGEVVWICDGDGSHPKGLGVEFVDLNHAQSEVIHTILRDYINVQR